MAVGHWLLAISQVGWSLAGWHINTSILPVIIAGHVRLSMLVIAWSLGHGQSYQWLPYHWSLANNTHTGHGWHQGH